MADDAALLESALRGALSRADLVITTGGLGPTEDDLTREAAAAALGRRLVRDAGIVESLRARFASFGRVMPATNEKQGDLIEGARALENPRGTAPGQRVEHEGRVLVLLPGPPDEMKPLFETHVLPGLRSQGRVIRRRVLKIAGMSESGVDEIAAPVYREFTNPRTTILGAPGQIELHLVGEGAGPREADDAIESLAGASARASPRAHLQRGRPRPPGGGGRPSCWSGGSPWRSPSPAPGACCRRG